MLLNCFTICSMYVVYGPGTQYELGNQGIERFSNCVTDQELARGFVYFFLQIPKETSGICEIWPIL
jgi:hypothetical protein